MFGHRRAQSWAVTRMYGVKIAEEEMAEVRRLPEVLALLRQKAPA